MDVDHILIAGMRHIRILLPLEILGHLAVLALSQILIHAIRGNAWCASSWLVLQSCLLQWVATFAPRSYSSSSLTNLSPLFSQQSRFQQSHRYSLLSSCITYWPGP